MTDPTFHFSLEGSWVLGIKELWPDGDGPENPTLDDVKDLARERFSMGEWNMRPALYIDGEFVTERPSSL